PAHRRDSACVHFTWKQRPEEVAALLPEIEERLAPFAPRPHWGKVFTTAPEQVRAQYPRLPDFLALRERLDPRRVFTNAYVERLRGARAPPRRIIPTSRRPHDPPALRLCRPSSRRPVPPADGLELLGQLRHHRHRGRGARQCALPRR